MGKKGMLGMLGTFYGAMCLKIHFCIKMMLLFGLLSQDKEKEIRSNLAIIQATLSLSIMIIDF
jgi:hypothetical protein